MPDLYKSECYCTNLRRSANAISEFYDEQLKDTGLTVPQYYLLINLRRLGSANITHWAERVGLDRSTMVRNIRVLQSRSFVEAAEGHGKVFRLSETGEKALDPPFPSGTWLRRRWRHFWAKQIPKQFCASEANCKD